MQVIRNTGRRATLREMQRKRVQFGGFRLGNKIVIITNFNPNTDTYVEETTKVPLWRQEMNRQMCRRVSSTNTNLKRMRPLEYKLVDGPYYELWESCPR